MRGNRSLRHLAVAAALLQHALALPQGGITIAHAPVPWVTVDPAGSAQTVTPAVITTEGHRATLSNAPSSLLSTATYTLSPSGRASTYTGVAPVASATGTDGSLAGVFPACDSNANVGPVEPFCLPKAGSELHPGQTYYITWSPTYFSPPTLPLSLQVLYSDITTTTPGEATIGFTSPTTLPANTGFYAWTIPSDFLASRGSPARYNVTFLLAYGDTSTPDIDNDLTTRIGPTVFITNPSSPGSSEGDQGGGGGGPNIVAIAVPVIVVGVLLLLLGVLCFFFWRKHGHLPCMGGRRRSQASSSGGYGVRQSRSERVGQQQHHHQQQEHQQQQQGPWGDNKSETDVGIQLTDRESWSPTGRSAGVAGEGGRNVFREEVARQARLR
ncbi:hypothetical protein C8A00DRAFT_17035 [Chaetomidium leptoderma]|uniref:Uncharacterized protein n=1 Tax=Chaetomidium leptoderma TaxID=669021 RepID=A0AAN6ZWP6_9PEZI|nr:hypothetical protein C8A00DRAFT_17035 [Chaetomidium leptoderma]